MRAVTFLRMGYGLADVASRGRRPGGFYRDLHSVALAIYIQYLHRYIGVTGAYVPRPSPGGTSSKKGFYVVNISDILTSVLCYVSHR